MYDIVSKSYENVLKAKIDLSGQSLLHVAFRVSVGVNTFGLLILPSLEAYLKLFTSNTVKNLLHILLNLRNLFQ
jgi:hypothetical protein